MRKSCICDWVGSTCTTRCGKEGGIILGTGGDNSDGAVGTFFEGAMVTGYVSDEVDAAIQANIVAAGYGK